MEIKSNEMGVCPICNEDNLDYGVAQFEGDMLYFPWTCCNCKITGEEWYVLEFNGHNLNTENGVIEITNDMIEK